MGFASFPRLSLPRGGPLWRQPASPPQAQRQGQYMPQSVRSHAIDWLAQCPNNVTLVEDRVIVPAA